MQLPSPRQTQRTEPEYSLARMVLYFLRLGTFGFGGPIALAGYMQRDLVENRKWLTNDEYLEGLALSQLAPGPLAAQLAMYLGFLRAGWLGATLVALAFIGPSFVMVVLLAVAYVRYGGLPWMQAAFYGIGAAVIGIIARSAWKLMKTTLKSDVLLWIIFAVLAVSTAATEREIVWLFLAGGMIALAIEAFPRRAVSAPMYSLVFLPLILPGSLGKFGEVLGYFAKAGLFVFGSGLAIVPFLHGGVVVEHRWLNERQFLDAVAVAMITPGPVVITVAFIGYIVAGAVGATVAALGVFQPCYLFVIIPAKYFRRYAKNAYVKAFVDGVTAAAIGAIAGAVYVLARRSLIDVPTVLIAVFTLTILMFTKKIPEPVTILAAGVVGILLHGKV